MADTGKTKKIEWLSILQGWAMMLVVIGHFDIYGDVSEPIQTAWNGSIKDVIYSFHMPLFMFASGGLFYLTRIARGWHTRDVYKDKALRLLLPYIVFTTVAFTLKAVIGIGKRGVDLSWHNYLMSLLEPLDGPLAEMWFIGTLMWLMLLYPFYKVFLKNIYLEIALLAFAVYLAIAFWFRTDVNIPLDLFNVSGVTRYTLFFYGGILFFKYRLERWLNGYTAIVFAILFATSFLIGGRDFLATPIVGILFSVSFAKSLAALAPEIFGSFRDYTYQIFLMGLFPQMAVEIVCRKWGNDWNILPIGITSVLAGLYIPVIISRLAVKSRWKAVHLCLSLK